MEPTVKNQNVDEVKVNQNVSKVKSSNKNILYIILIVLVIIGVIGIVAVYLIYSFLIKNDGILNNRDQNIEEETEEEENPEAEDSEEDSNEEESLEESYDYSKKDKTYSFDFNGYRITVSGPDGLITSESDPELKDIEYNFSVPKSTEDGGIALIKFTNYELQTTYTPGEEFETAEWDITSVDIGSRTYDTAKYCMGEGFMGDSFFACNFLIKLEDDLWVSILKQDSSSQTVCLETGSDEAEAMGGEGNIVILDDCSDYEPEILSSTITTDEDLAIAKRLVESIEYSR